MFSEVLTISAITAWKWGPEQPSPSLRTKVCKHTFCWIPAYFYVNLAGDEKSTNFSAVVSLLFKTMCHLPQGFTTEQGIQRVAKCFFFSKGRSEWTLYLHFNREAVQCNPFWYHCLHCYLCLSFFLRLSACECVHALIWFLKNKNKKHVTPVFLLTSKFVYTDPFHQMFSQHDQCATDVHITYGT